MPSDLLTIGEMSKKYQISLRTLRFYEDEGLISPIRKGVSRFYQPSDEVRVELVLKGKRLGFCIREIRDLIGVASLKYEAPLPEDVVELLQSIQLREKIAELEARRNDVQSTLEELQTGLLPVSWTPRLGVFMKPEVADATTEVRA